MALGESEAVNDGMVLELRFSQQGSGYTSFSSRVPEAHVVEPLKSSIAMFYEEKSKSIFTSSVLHSSVNSTGLSPLTQELYEFSTSSNVEVMRPPLGTFGKFYSYSCHIYSH